MGLPGLGLSLTSPSKACKKPNRIEAVQYGQPLPVLIAAPFLKSRVFGDVEAQKLVIERRFADASDLWVE